MIHPFPFLPSVYLEGETLEFAYGRLVAEGYNKTNEDIELEEVDDETLRNIELAGGGS